MSKKGNGYFVSTVFTNIQVLDPVGITIDNKSLHRKFDPKFETNLVSKPLIQHCAQQNVPDESLEVFECLLTLEIIYKISIRAMCKACGSMVSSAKSCSFAGCHIPVAERDIKYICNAVFQMEDETQGATIYVNDLAVCRKMVHFIDDNEWELVLQTVENKGEILYLSKTNSATEKLLLDKIDIHSGVETCFNILCEVYPMTNYSQFICKLRPFSNDKQSSSAYWNDDKLNFMCLDANSCSKLNKTKI